MSIPSVRVKLSLGNRLIGTHVHAAGDVVELPGELAKHWIKLGIASITEEPATAKPMPRLRSEVLAEEDAASKAPGKAERAVSRGRNAATAFA